jgi:calcium/calmodulin-dependent protein kinase I
LNHKNIIKCEGIFSDERDQVYTVLELVDGGELNEVVNEFGAFSERDGQCVAFQLCQAIECLHSVNMIHRDIKPENILVTEKGVVKLADFGLATQTHPDDPTAVGCVGTHSFQAPEILMGVPYTASVDMWALGVTIYILLAAKKPFPKVGQNKAMQRCKILNGEYDFFGEVWRHISAEAKDFITKLLQLRPNERMTITEALEHPWMKAVINLKTFGERWSARLELRKKVNKRSTNVPSRTRETKDTPERSYNSYSRYTTDTGRPERSAASIYVGRSVVTNTTGSSRSTDSSLARPERSHASSYTGRSTLYSEPTARSTVSSPSYTSTRHTDSSRNASSRITITDTTTSRSRDRDTDSSYRTRDRDTDTSSYRTRDRDTDTPSYRNRDTNDSSYRPRSTVTSTSDTSSYRSPDRSTDRSTRVTSSATRDRYTSDKYSSSSSTASDRSRSVGARYTPSSSTTSTTFERRRY